MRGIAILPKCFMTGEEGDSNAVDSESRCYKFAERSLDCNRIWRKFLSGYYINQKVYDLLL